MPLLQDGDDERHEARGATVRGAVVREPACGHTEARYAHEVSPEAQESMPMAALSGVAKAFASPCDPYGANFSRSRQGTVELNALLKRMDATLPDDN